MGAERRNRAIHDVLGQRQHFGSVRVVARLDGGAAGDGMQHPLGLFPQSVAAAVDQLRRDFHDHIFHVVHRHIGGHSADNDGGTAEILRLDARIGQQVDILAKPPAFRRRSD